MKSLISSLIICLCLPFAYGQRSSQLPDQLETIASAYESIYGFSGHILVIQEDTLTWEASFGLANRSFEVPNTSETRFSINSISKTFLAVAILQLWEQKKLELHSPIVGYLPDLTATWKDSITIHHLLTHTSGLPRESGIQAHQNLKFAEQVSLVDKQGLLFPPGQEYGYSNSGIILLGAILEAVAQKPYEQYLQTNILEPLNLHHSGVYQGRSIVLKQAVPYRFTSRGLEMAQRSKHWGDNAGGGLYSTASDLYQFVLGLERGVILSQASRELLFFPHVQSGRNEYEAYTWSIKQFGSEKIYFAAGSGYGTKSVIIRGPESGNFIAILSNWGNTPILPLLRDLYLTTKGQEVQAPNADQLARPEAFSSYLGVYQFSPGELTKHLGMEEDQIVLQEYAGKVFLNEELMASKDQKHLQLTYTEELKISFQDRQMIILINGQQLAGERVD